MVERSESGEVEGFGALLRACRLDAGLTQEELADHAGVSVRTIGDLERGRAVPHRHTVDRLSVALDLDDQSRQALATHVRTTRALRRPGTPPRPLEWAVGEPSAREAAPPPRRRPAQLPHDIPDFLGRDAEIAQVRHAASGTSPGIWVLDGPGGCGKTALAVHLGHRVAGQFPDGQLYTDLRGFHLHQPPLSPAAVLSQFLRALDVDNHRIPTDPDELASMFRSILADRRVLVVLDNTASTEQVRALLPGAPGCLTLVTSRHRLSGLVARDGAHRLTLGAFDRKTAADLLASIIGAGRVSHEPEALAELARLSGCLPLALRITAERARTHLTLRDLVAGLNDEQERLNLLATDDENTSVRAVFSWSYRALEPAAARLFRLLGLHPGRDFTALAAAALADQAQSEVRPLLAGLADRHLIERGDGGRYQFHDLMRAYATEQARIDEPRAELGRARQRLIGWYLAAAVAADRRLSPQRYRITLDSVTSEHELPGVRTYRDAVEWCDAELANLVATVQLASAVGEHTRAWQLSWALVGYFDLRRPWNAWLTTHKIALASARLCQDRLGEAAVLTSLGLAYYYPRRFAEADDCYQRAGTLWQQLGDRRGAALILNGTGNIYLETRRFDQAIDSYLQVLEVYRDLGDRRGEGVVLANLAETYCELGSFDHVLDYAARALEVNRETGNPRAEGFSLCHLGHAIAATRTGAAAEGYFRQAVEVGRGADDRHMQAWALDYFGTALYADGKPREAARAWHGAVAIFDALHDPRAVDLRSRLASLTARGNGG